MPLGRRFAFDHGLFSPCQHIVQLELRTPINGTNQIVHSRRTSSGNRLCKKACVVLGKSENFWQRFFGELTHHFFPIFLEYRYRLLRASLESRPNFRAIGIGYLTSAFPGISG